MNPAWSQISFAEPPIELAPAIRFTVPGPIVGKGRARSVPLMRDGRPVIGYGGRPMVIHHTPEKTTSYESLIRVAAEIAMGDRPPIAGPVAVSLMLAFAIPASWSKRRHAAALAGDIRPTVKPDADNVLKAICDGCNGIVFIDDKQVTEVHLIKRYDIAARVRVTVQAVGEP